MAKAKPKQIASLVDELEANIMECDNTDLSSLDPGQPIELIAEQSDPNYVYVFANLPTAQSFRLPDGNLVSINGVPVSSLRRADGGFYPGGKYGVTRLPVAIWERIAGCYGSMRMFRSGLVFAAPNLEAGRAMARERGNLRHGHEPIDPASPRAKTQPRSLGHETGDPEWL